LRIDEEDMGARNLVRCNDSHSLEKLRKNTSVLRDERGEVVAG